MKFSVKRFVDFRLQMLDTYAHGKGLGLHGDAHAVQHPKGIPCAVTDGEDAVVAVDDLAVLQFHTGEGVVLGLQIGDLGVEADLAAQGDDLVADVLDNGKQHIGAHMGLGII